MAGDGPGDLYDLAAELRDVCVEALDSIPLFAGLEDLLGAPTIQYVSPSAPAAECCDGEVPGMLAVHVNNITDQLARTGDGGAPKLNVPSLIVTATRCVQIVDESGALLDTAELEAQARQHMADGWALWNHIYNLIRAEEFLTRCQRIAFQAMIPIPADGGCGGWQLNFLPQLDGYEDPGT